MKDRTPEQMYKHLKSNTVEKPADISFSSRYSDMPF